MASCHLHHKLHRHVARSQSAGLRWSGAVEIILFMVLLKTSVGDENVIVIQAAILGSILANILLCLGCCFIAGRRGISNGT
jgi:hypothetical protein